MSHQKNTSKGSRLSLASSPSKPIKSSITYDLVSPSKPSTTSYIKPTSPSKASYPSESIKYTPKITYNYKPNYQTPKIPTPKYNEPKVPRTIITPKIDRDNKPKSTNVFNRETLSKAFEVLVRSKGKINVVGKGLTRGEALRLGVKTTKGSTAQTFAIRESGTTTKRDINYKVPEQLFSTPKRKSTLINDMTFTERRGKTLTERKEITSLKSSKRRKSKFSLL